MEVETHLFKILVVGDSHAGKTALIDRYANNKYNTDGYKATIGVEFTSKLVRWQDGDNPIEFDIHLWDLAGQERFATQVKSYFRNSAGAICVYDITKETTPNNILKWKKLVENNSLGSCILDLEKIPCVMLVNKIDLVDNIQPDEINKTAKDLGFIGGFGVSALNGNGINDAIKTLLTEVYKKRKKYIEDECDKDIIKISNSQNSVYQKTQYCFC